MNQYEARKAIAQRWMTQWPALSTNTPFVFDEDAANESVPAYARISISFEPSEQRTLGEPGNRKFTRRGSIIVELFVEAVTGGGTKRLDELTQYVITIFEEVRFGAVGSDEPITTFASEPGRTSSAGQFKTISVGVDFEYVEVR